MLYVLPNKRFERDAPTAGFAACFRAPQANDMDSPLPIDANGAKLKLGIAPY